MPALDDVGLQEIPARAEEIARLVGERESVWVRGPAGSGRSTLVDELLRCEPELAVVRTPPLVLDGPAHLLLQILGAAGGEQAKRHARDSGASLRARLKAPLERLLGRCKGLVLVLSPGWVASTDHVGSNARDELAHARQRAGELLHEILGKARLVVITDAAWTWPRRKGSPHVVELSPARAPQTFLDREDVWGPLAEDARRLHAALGGRAAWLHPIALRIGVAATALGRTHQLRAFLPRKVARALEESETLASAHLLLETLAQSVPDLRRALLRLSRARFDIPRGLLDALIASEDSAIRDVVRHCLTYGETDRRVAVPLRRVAGAGRGPELETARQEAHACLHDHYLSLDGASRVEDALPRALNWLERLHHGMRAGGERLDEVRRVDLGCRELYWSLGRSLSRAGRFRDAAEVFGRCLARIDAQDPYAHHYLAFNLDQAGVEPQAVERHYRRALELERDNAWWSSRWITWLIDRGRPREAGIAWESALEQLDPSGVRLQADSWLAYHLHRWVIRAALEHDQLALARSALESLPRNVVEQEPEIAALAARIEIAEFIDRHGHALHPDTVPLEHWWTRPQHLPLEDGGEPLEAWYPGRVTRTEPLELVLGDPEAGQRGEPRILGLQLAAGFRIAGDLAVGEGQFVYAARYRGGDWIIFPIPGEPVSEETLSDARRMVRYLLRTR